MNVATLLSEVALARPHSPALITPRGQITFGALDREARHIAVHLGARAVGSGDGVLFFEPPSVALYASLAAVFRLGAVAMFVEPSAGRRVLADACAMWAPRAMIATPKAHLLRLVVPALRRIPVMLSTGMWVPFASRLPASGPRSSATPERPEGEVEMAAVTDETPALLTFTSGSTGRPKAAVRTHGILRAQLEALGAELAAHPGERELTALPIVVLLNLASGAETILPDADLRRPGEIDARPVLRQLSMHGATRVMAAPAFLERLVEVPTDALAGVRTIVTGGGPVFPDLVARLERAAPGARIVSVYGSTEAEPIAHVTNDEVGDAERAAMRGGAGLLAGLPDPVVRLRILRTAWGTPITGPGAAHEAGLDAVAFDALAVAAGEVGEIVVTGPHVVRGYLHGRGDEETKFRVDGTVWHRTGDLGRLDEHGRLWLLGRASAAIGDARGTLYPFAVECAARLAMGGGRVAMLAHDRRRLLVIEEPSRSCEAALHEALAWASLDRIVTVERIPMDRRHNSKVDYTALAELLTSERAR